LTEFECRACRGGTGQVVLDLGQQPACDYFPRTDDRGPDPVYLLQMWLCSGCGLAQLTDDPTMPQEPRGVEPAALAAQAADAVRKLAAAGLLPPAGAVAEYGSPHGGSWLDLLAGQGLGPAADGAPADVIIDCFGLMHDADQAAALAERAARIAPGGTLLLQYHSLATIIRCGQWNSLRHGHYAYYSTTALVNMLAAQGLSPRMAWQFDLYGGTVLLAAGRRGDAHQHDTLLNVLTDEAGIGVRDPVVLAGLQRDCDERAGALRSWLIAARSAGRNVVGYGAASRAVALLRKAGIDSSLLPAIADASPTKQGLRMPGTDIPVVSPVLLAERSPEVVLLFLEDLRAEVRATYPGVEAAGGEWLDVESLGRGAKWPGGTLAEGRAHAGSASLQ
jgi:C-methyltransferase C-terminal domain/Putative zinc binding domain